MRVRRSEDEKPRACSLTGLTAVVALLVAVAALLVATTRTDSKSSGPDTTATPARVAVPVLVGQSLSAARSELALVGLGVATVHEPSVTVPQGDVIIESPVGGTGVPAKATVTVTVSSGPPAPGQTAPVVNPPATVVTSTTTAPAGG